MHHSAKAPGAGIAALLLNFAHSLASNGRQSKDAANLNRSSSDPRARLQAVQGFVVPGSSRCHSLTDRGRHTLFLLRERERGECEEERVCVCVLRERERER
jgi:hypothetical protein